MHLKSNVWNPNFSHIYIEKSIVTYPRVKEILSCFKGATILLINDYRNIFDRPRQSYAFQKKSQALILARKKKDFIYPASRVCQSFDERYFYYCSTVMNCVYDCQYCFLKGMYPSGHLLVYVNIEDFFTEVENLLKQHPVYLCISYDSDLLAVEQWIHYGKLWGDFALRHPDLTIEIRTKGFNPKLLAQLPKNERIIYAFTLSCDEICCRYEQGTPSLMKRLRLARLCYEKGYTVRLCFDPLLLINDWQKKYVQFIDTVDKAIDLCCIKDVSIGSFRISKAYLKQMRRDYPKAAVLQYPYECIDGFYQYPPQLQQQMETTVADELKKRMDENKIYVWKE